MSGPDETVREALAELLARHPREVVTDPNRIGALLREHLRTGAPVDDVLLDAIVLATHTPVLRQMRDDARADTTEAQLATELRKLGVTERVVAGAAAAWVGALLPAATAPAPPRMQVVAPRPGPPPAFAPRPPLPRVQLTPPPRAEVRATLLGEPAAPGPATLRPEPRPQPVAGIIGGGNPPLHRPRRSSGMTKLLVAVLAVLAVAAGALAFVGWNRDPSKTRAADAETTVASLSDDLRAAEKAVGDAKATIAERDARLNAANAQIEKLSTLTRAQYNSAAFPEQFAMTGKVAPGSCSLTGDACNVTAALRAIKLTCSAKPCDCTTGTCTVTSELWKAPAAVKYDPASALFTAKGLLDGDVFRCGGVAQPTTYDFRFRVSKITYGDGAWRASGVDAELAEASASGSECLAGNRTYALSGPSA